MIKLKRVIDLAACTLGILLLPLMLVVAIAILMVMSWPIFFRQKRLGFREEIFTVYKFRTMTEDRDQSGGLLPDDLRLTELGRILRRSSLDELPQLWNVLKGDISLIGPRPLLPEYLPRYNRRQRRRHEVKPGITGWAQINGRNALTWEQKLELDIWYVDHRSFMLDVKILCLTALRVLRRDGISQQGHATMPEFLGTPTQSSPNE